MHGSALLAAPNFFVTVKALENGRQVLHDALESQFSAMYKVVAIRAIPLKGVEGTLRARHFDDHPDGVGRSLR
jgi:hypothetical protein